MSIALIGVIAMQFFFIRESYHQKSQIFDETVKASLSLVANKLERQEVIEFASKQEKIIEKDQKLRKEKEAILADQVKIQEQLNNFRVRNFTAMEKYANEEKVLKQMYPNAAEVQNSFFETYVRNKKNHSLITIDFEQTFDDPSMPTLPTISTLVGARKRIQPMIKSKDDSVRFVIPIIDPFSMQAHSFRWATLPPKMDHEALRNIEELEQKIQKLNFRKLSIATNLIDTIAILGGKDNKVMADISTSLAMSKRPLKERIKPDIALHYIQEELDRRGIHSPFVMQIRSNPRAPLVIQAAYNVSETDFENYDHSNEYSIPLFQGDQGSSPGLLTIFFPSKRFIIANNMNYMIFPMVALLALLVGCFAYTLNIIFKQKKMSEMKTDFINNMTHEFKTPVATIMIASESLKDPEISANEKRVAKLANIIYDENVRLGSHIERVLNIAKLEKENLKIEWATIHMNSLIADVVDSMQLQLEKAEGEFHIDLKANADKVQGDELHLSNVIFNLIDNAIKYSTERPQITIKSYNSKNNIVISVADKGIGMSKEHQDKIFEQFYRIPTGNIHNVKGFGLGLNYVNNIVKLLNGKISVKSEKDKGTQFEVILPLA